MKNVSTWVIVGIIAVLTIIGIATYISYSNTEIDLREATEAQQDVCKANFDKMFKVISQLAEIPEHFADESKEAFKEIYPQLMEGRYDNDRGGALMSWVSEQNPTYDMAAIGELYEKLANAIEANRAEYFVEQKKLIDLQREHSALLKKFPGSLLLNGREEIDIIIITSTQTEQVYVDGQENDIELFD